MKQEITFEDYSKVEIRVGTVLKVSKNEKANAIVLGESSNDSHCDRLRKENNKSASAPV